MTDQCPVCFPVATASASTDIELPTHLTEFIEKVRQRLVYIIFRDTGIGGDELDKCVNSCLEYFKDLNEEKEREIERLNGEIKRILHGVANGDNLAWELNFDGEPTERMKAEQQIQSLTEERDKWKELANKKRTP